MQPSRPSVGRFPDWHAAHSTPNLLYFPSGHVTQPVLSFVGDTRRDTLIARRKKTKNGIVYRFDVRLGGEGETVFFDV